MPTAFPSIHFECICDIQKQPSGFFFFFFGPFLPSPLGRFNSSSPSMRLRLASRRQTKPVAAWLGRNVREATHEDRAPREFSRTRTAASPDFFHAPSHPCPLLGRPPRNENPISHWSWQLISPFAAFSICSLPGLGAGSVPILPENTRLFFLFFFLAVFTVSFFSHAGPALWRGKIKISKTPLRCISLRNLQK